MLTIARFGGKAAEPVDDSALGSLPATLVAEGLAITGYSDRDMMSAIGLLALLVVLVLLGLLVCMRRGRAKSQAELVALKAEHGKELKQLKELVDTGLAKLQKSVERVRDVEVAEVEWVVDRFKVRAANGAHLFSQAVLVAGFELHLSLEFHKNGYLGLFIGHAGGGLGFLPIRIAGSSIGIVDQGAPSRSKLDLHNHTQPMAISQTMEDGDTISTVLSSFGFPKFIEVAELRKQADRLLKNDSIKIRAVLCVGRHTARSCTTNLKTEEEMTGAQEAQ